MCLSKVSKWPNCQSHQPSVQKEIYKKKEKHLYLDRAMIFYLHQKLLVCISFSFSPTRNVEYLILKSITTRFPWAHTPRARRNKSTAHTKRKSLHFLPHNFHTCPWYIREYALIKDHYHQLNWIYFKHWMLISGMPQCVQELRSSLHRITDMFRVGEGL